MRKALVGGAIIAAMAVAPVLMATAAFADPGDPGTGQGNISVTVDSIISLTMTDSDVALSGVANEADVTGTDGAMAYTVTTNNATGYSVAVKADAANLVGQTPGNADVIPVSAISVTNSEVGAGAGGTIAAGGALSTSDTALYSKDVRTEAAGDQLKTDFTADLPFVNSDTYTGTVTFTATASS